MTIRKHGEGTVVPGEDVSKTASKEEPEQREQRLAALAEENDKADE